MGKPKINTLIESKKYNKPLSISPLLKGRRLFPSPFDKGGLRGLLKVDIRDSDSL